MRDLSSNAGGRATCHGLRGVQALNWGTARICTRPGAPAAFRASMPAVTIPVRTKDFSQSAVEGPRIFPSI